MADAPTRSEPKLAGHQIAWADSILAETQRLSQLVDNLLDMARLEAGEVKLNAQWQPVEEVVGSALRVSRPVLLAHQIVTHLPADLPLVRFDALLIERVLCNLLENAAEYTPTDSTTPSLRASWATGSKSRSPTTAPVSPLNLRQACSTNSPGPRRNRRCVVSGWVWRFAAPWLKRMAEVSTLKTCRGTGQDSCSHCHSACLQRLKRKRKRKGLHECTTSRTQTFLLRLGSSPNGDLHVMCE